MAKKLICFPMDEILRLNIGCGEIHAVFTYIKRGANYGIKFLRLI